MNNYKSTSSDPADYIFIGYEIWTKEELAEYFRRQDDKQGE